MHCSVIDVRRSRLDITRRHPACLLLIGDEVLRSVSMHTREELAPKAGHPYLCARNNTGILDRFNGVKDEGA